jgi:hypothetical protein
MRCQVARQLIVFVEMKSNGWKNDENRYAGKRRGIVVSRTTGGQKELHRDMASDYRCRKTSFWKTASVGILFQTSSVLDRNKMPPA